MISGVVVEGGGGEDDQWGGAPSPILSLAHDSAPGWLWLTGTHHHPARLRLCRVWTRSRRRVRESFFRLPAARDPARDRMNIWWMGGRAGVGPSVAT
jgi:hypothetical protein